MARNVVEMMNNSGPIYWNFIRVLSCFCGYDEFAEKPRGRAASMMNKCSIGGNDDNDVYNLKKFKVLFGRLG